MMRYETIISELKKYKACILKRKGVAKAGDGSYRGVGPRPALGPPSYAWEVKVVPDCRANASPLADKPKNFCPS